MAIRILVVDDERPILDSLREIIVSAGYNVFSASSSEEALAKSSEFSPDVLLTDVLIPGTNGFELALQIKKSYPNCRLLFFSGQATTAQLATDYIQIFTRLGYRFALLPKPIHPTELLKKLEESLTQMA
jgi:CheY-like chemotaxis protein